MKNYELSTDTTDDFCRACKEKTIRDAGIYLCEDCYNKFCDACNDILPNISQEYNSNISESERDKEISSLGSHFNLTLKEVKELI